MNSSAKESAGGKLANRSSSALRLGRPVSGSSRAKRASSPWAFSAARRASCSADMILATLTMSTTATATAEAANTLGSTPPRNVIETTAVIEGTTTAAPRSKNLLVPVSAVGCSSAISGAEPLSAVAPSSTYAKAKPKSVKATRVLTSSPCCATAYTMSVTKKTNRYPTSPQSAGLRLVVPNINPARVPRSNKSMSG